MTDHTRSKRSAIATLGAAALLVGAALTVRHRARRAEADYPPVGRFVTVDGVRLHYVDRGRGRPVVLLHGNGAMLQDFELSGVVDLLSRNYRVLVFDRPGFGYSERPRGTIWTPRAQADLIRKAFRQLGADRPIVVGHSWGTLVSLALALDHPETVSGLVLLAGYYFPTPRLDVSLVSPTAIPVLGDLVHGTVSPLVGRVSSGPVIRKLFAPAPVPPRFSAFPVDLSLRPSQIHASAADTALMIPGAADLSRHYADLDLPVILMAGVGDRIVDADQARRMHAHVPGSVLRMVEGAGHMVHYAVPGDVRDAVDAVANRPMS